MTSTALPKALHIGIVGLGTAGLASSIFLSRLGHKIDIFEKSSKNQLTEVVGAGIGVQPIGLTVLKRLDVLDNVLKHGSRINHLHALTREGKTVLDLHYADFHPSLHGVGLHRDALFQSLYDKIKTDTNITVIPNMNVVNVEENTQTCRNNSKNSYIVRRHHETNCSLKEGPYDMVIVADGRDSIRSNMLHVKSYESKYKYGCLWSILPDTKNEFTKNDGNEGATLFQRLDSAKTMLGLLPTGRTPDMSTSDAKLVSLFWSLPMNHVAQLQKEGLNKWKETVISLEPRTQDLLEHITSFDQLIPAEYSDTFMPKLYDEVTRTAFIGDCAHATSPQLGQGANLALVDAYVLANAIDQHNGNVLPALFQYDSERKWRLRFYQLNSRLLTPVFQSDSKVIGALRDLTMGAMCRFPLTKLQMLTVLCGAQNNGIPWTTIPKDEFMGFTYDDAKMERMERMGKTLKLTRQVQNYEDGVM